MQSAKEHLSEAEANSQSMQNTVARMVAMESVEVDTHLTLSRRDLVGLLPSSRSSLTIAQEQYASGQGDFMRLLEAYRTWIDANNEYQEQLYHYGEHWSALEQWLGIRLVPASHSPAAPTSPPEETHD